MFKVCFYYKILVCNHPESKHPSFYFILTGILTLVQIILFSQAGSYWQIILLIAFAVLFSSIIFYILFFYIQPKASFFQSSFHWRQVLKTIFLHSNSLLSIKEGQIDQDYFLLNTKPREACVYIHPDSAASIVNSRGDFRVVSSGFHELRFGESITTSFPLGMQIINCGPQEGENPFSKRKSGENYTSFHSQAFTRADGAFGYGPITRKCFLVFTIQYCLCKNGEFISETLLDIAKLLSQNNMSGPASPAINAIITKQICGILVGTNAESAPCSLLIRCKREQLPKHSPRYEHVFKSCPFRNKAILNCPVG